MVWYNFHLSTWQRECNKIKTTLLHLNNNLITSSTRTTTNEEARCPCFCLIFILNNLSSVESSKQKYYLHYINRSLLSHGGNLWYISRAHNLACLCKLRAVSYIHYDQIREILVFAALELKTHIFLKTGLSEIEDIDFILPFLQKGNFKEGKHNSFHVHTDARFSYRVCMGTYVGKEAVCSTHTTFWPDSLGHL